MDGDMWQEWGHMVGSGGMWQGVGACGRGGGRGWWQVWGHVAGVRYVVGGQANDMDGDMVGVGACGRVWGHVTGCGECGRVWGHVAGCGACGRGGGMW